MGSEGRDRKALMRHMTVCVLGSNQSGRGGIYVMFFSTASVVRWEIIQIILIILILIILVIIIIFIIIIIIIVIIIIIIVIVIVIVFLIILILIILMILIILIILTILIILINLIVLLKGLLNYGVDVLRRNLVGTSATGTLESL